MTIHQDLLMGGRVDFAALCDLKHLKTAVEVGTDKGIFAREFLDRWHGEMLYCVDPYTRYPHMPWNRAGDMHLAISLLAPHARRVRMVMATSEEAAAYFKGDHLPSQIGFVYIDGDHTHEAVMADLHRWWPLVQPGGILAGDDFLHNSGVRAAVQLFAQEIGLDISTVSDYNREVSWFFEKPL